MMKAGVLLVTIQFIQIVSTVVSNPTTEDLTVWVDPLIVRRSFFFLLITNWMIGNSWCSFECTKSVHFEDRSSKLTCFTTLEFSC